MVPSAITIGKKADTVTIEEIISGPLRVLTASRAALVLSIPFSMFTMIASEITIPLSTSIPNTIIRAASEI